MHRITLLLAGLALAACNGTPAAGPAGDGTDGDDAEAPAAKDIRTATVTYAAGGVTLRGFLAWDAATDDPRPGVLVMHEWWGLNDYARRRARMLAELGYTALAVDMYGDGKTADNPTDAGALAGAARKDMTVAQQRFEAARALLAGHATTDPGRIAAIGYCFGGSMVLDMARAGVELAAVASFHGGLKTATPAQPGAISAKVLVCHGEADPTMPPEAVAAFKKEMADAGVDLTFRSYPGAKHAFTNPEADTMAARFPAIAKVIGYDQAADAQSWAELRQFFDGVFAD